MMEAYGARFYIPYIGTQVVGVLGILNIMTATLVEGTFAAIKKNEEEKKEAQYKQSHVRTVMRDFLMQLAFLANCRFAATVEGDIARALSFDIYGQYVVPDIPTAHLDDILSDITL